MSNNDKAARTTAHSAFNPRSFPWISTLLATLLALGLFVGISGAILLIGLDNQVKGAVIDLEKFSQSTDPGPAIPADGFAGRPVNLIVIGIDSRAGENANVGAGTPDVIESELNDTNMLIHLSADRTSATVVSIPRDLMTTLATCQTINGDFVGGDRGQFNTAFSLPKTWEETDTAAGIACVQATTELLSGMKMDGFAIIDFVGFQDLVKTLGGLEICVDTEVEDVEAQLEPFGPGCKKLSPDQALAYSRARKDPSLGDGSDIGRIGRQHEVVSAMVDEVMKTNILTDFLKLHAFVQEALNTMSVSQSLSDLTADMGLLSSLKGIPAENFRFVTLPWGTDPEDPNRVVALEPLAGDMWAALQNDTSLPPGTPFKTMGGDYFIVGDDGAPIPAEDNGGGLITPIDPSYGTTDPGTEEFDPSYNEDYGNGEY